jgi:saccharopine dehydrogenase-like NADP-dependent oxidoreductase
MIGAGSIGLPIAYDMAMHRSVTQIVLTDLTDPIAMTSARSGVNYCSGGSIR